MKSESKPGAMRIEPAAHVRDHCVLVADAARARVWVLERERSGGTEISELVEVADITNPMLRARNVDLVSHSGTGRRGGAGARLHSTADHRDHHRREIECHFAAEIAEEAAAVSRRFPSCELIVVAGPVTLGLLRPAIDRQIGADDQIRLRELARDLTKLTGAALHDLLAEEKLLPERDRLAPAPAASLPA